MNSDTNHNNNHNYYTDSNNNSKIILLIIMSITLVLRTTIIIIIIIRNTIRLPPRLLSFSAAPCQNRIHCHTIPLHNGRNIEIQIARVSSDPRNLNSDVIKMSKQHFPNRNIKEKTAKWTRH